MSDALKEIVDGGSFALLAAIVLSALYASRRVIERVESFVTSVSSANARLAEAVAKLQTDLHSIVRVEMSRESSIDHRLETLTTKVDDLRGKIDRLAEDTSGVHAA